MSEFSCVMNLCKISAKKIKEGIWTQSDYHREFAKLYRELGMIESAELHEAQIVSESEEDEGLPF